MEHMVWPLGGTGLIKMLNMSHGTYQDAEYVPWDISLLLRRLGEVPGDFLAGMGASKREQEVLSAKVELKPSIRAGWPYVDLNLHPPPRMKGFKAELTPKQPTACSAK